MQENNTTDNNNDGFIKKYFVDTPVQKRWYVAVMGLVMAVIIVVICKCIGILIRMPHTSADSSDIPYTNDGAWLKDLQNTDTSDTSQSSITDTEYTTEEVYTEAQTWEETTTEYNYDADWKNEFARFLDTADINFPSEFCLLCDLQKDGIPELIVNGESYDTSGMSYGFYVVTYDGSETIASKRIEDDRDVFYNADDDIFYVRRGNDYLYYRYSSDGDIVELEDKTDVDEEHFEDILGSYYEDYICYSKEDILKNIENGIFALLPEKTPVETESGGNSNDYSVKAAGKGYVLYTNNIKNFSVKIPDNYDKEASSLEDGSFSYPDGTTISIEYSTVSKTNPERWLNLMVDNPDYSFAGDDYIVYSDEGVRDIMYTCLHVEIGLQYGFTITYPISERDTYEQPVDKSILDVMYKYIASNKGTP